MNAAATSKRDQFTFAGAVWYQEAYFYGALQREIDRARQGGSALSLVVLRVAGCSRRLAQAIFAYAETEDGHCFFGMLANGDYAVCMPGCGYTEGALRRLALEQGLEGFDLHSGLAVLDRETTAAELVKVAIQNGVCRGEPRFLPSRAA